MPYNTTAIPPNEEPTGTTQLPFSRVKRIIATDQDIQIMSNAGAFVITLATEMFIQYLAQEALKVVKSDKKARRNIQYRDLATAVSNHDNLEFLVDIVPATTTLKQIRDRQTALMLAARPVVHETHEAHRGETNAANEVRHQETPEMSTSHSTQSQIAEFGVTDDAYNETEEDGSAEPDAQLHRESRLQERKAALDSAELLDVPQNTSAEDVEMTV